MKKVVRLTESDLRRMVLRVIQEQEQSKYQEMEEGLFGSFGDKFKEAVGEVADFFKNEVLSDLSKEEKDDIKDRLGDVSVDRELNKLEKKEEHEINEGYLTEGIFDRVKDFFLRVGVGLGGVIGVGGFIAFVSEITGWSESQLLTRIHEIVESVGLGRYSGPLSLLLFVIGIAMALGFTAMRHNRKHAK